MMETTSSHNDLTQQMPAPIVNRSESRKLDQAEQCFVLDNVSWEQYEGMLDALGERRLRHTYNNGRLELMSPSLNHDWEQYMLGRLLERMTEELRIPIKGIGSTTQRLKNHKQAVEPDECYYIAGETAMRGRGRRGDRLDLSKDPPPDLAIEVDVTNSSEPRLPIFASIGIREVWRMDEEGLKFLQLSETQSYDEIQRSIAFPFLSPSVLENLLTSQKNDLEIVLEFVAWVRQQQD